MKIDWKKKKFTQISLVYSFYFTFGITSKWKMFRFFKRIPKVESPYELLSPMRNNMMRFLIAFDVQICQRNRKVQHKKKKEMYSKMSVNWANNNHNRIWTEHWRLLLIIDQFPFIYAVKRKIEIATKCPSVWSRTADQHTQVTRWSKRQRKKWKGK